MRSNAANTGKAFERRLLATADAYRHQDVLRLAKVDPPVNVIGFGANRKVIFTENCFCDLIGAWTERGGRMLMIEAKSTSQPKLSLGGHLTDKQMEWLERWHYAGAAIGLIWEHKTESRFLPLGQILKTNKTRRHIKWEEAEPISQGQGFVLIDFVQNLRRWYPAA